MSTNPVRVIWNPDIQTPAGTGSLGNPFGSGLTYHNPGDPGYGAFGSLDGTVSDGSIGGVAPGLQDGTGSR